MGFGKTSPKRTMAKKFARKLKDKTAPKKGRIKTLKTKKLGVSKRGW